MGDLVYMGKCEKEEERNMVLFSFAMTILFALCK